MSEDKLLEDAKLSLEQFYKDYPNIKLYADKLKTTPIFPVISKGKGQKKKDKKSK